ncbi:RICIN domain-containing protein [Marinoscillum furvescens]|uniref:Putative secreted protein (Por secretion system target) n=1 Tax=Marinoscillum furvescens DSM 4134 TaxID=1122208 RepID=A0A3D9KZ02_MARFU|nr:RICIN domain-containing protein [Marinoscillum furvescens]RED95272.1 putative secreted protein (Por secretion system target) [Marinoscillum furvescens DSM 4134]
MISRIQTRLALVVVALFTFVQSHSRSFVNPISDLADPFITYHNGYYYYTGTTGGNISMRKSTTLEGLKAAPIQTIYTPSGSAPTHHYWAPEMFRINNTWYIYFSASLTTSTNDMRTWVLENTSTDPMAGTWVFKGRIYDSSNDLWAIDGTVLSLHGTNYFLWSGVDYNATIDKPQRIYIASMSNPWTLNSGRTLLSSPDMGWESNGGVNEAPEVIQKNGKVFMVYSANGCWTPDYKLGMLSMPDNLDPMNSGNWYKHPQPVFESNSAVQAYGPGHHFFFKSPDGTQDWFAYHATTNASGACDASRTTRAQKITWNADGTPNFGVPVATGIKQQAPAGEASLASASPIANGIYKIVVQSSNKPLDVAGCSMEKGANVHQWSDANVDCQKWHIQATSDGYYTITSVQGGLVLEVESCSNANAANVQMWAPNGADCQKWSFVSVGGGYYRIVSKQSGKSLDIQFGGQNNGANLQQYDYLGNSQQHFRMDWLGAESPIKEGVYRIVSKKSGLAMDLAGCNVSNGTNIAQWTWLNNNCQRWSVESTGDGYYMIRSQESNRVLDVPSCSGLEGANIQQWDAYGNDCQKFAIEPAGNGYFSIINKSSGHAVDVSNCSMSPGANIHQWSYWGGDCQLWKFEAVTSSARLATTSDVEEKKWMVYPNPTVGQVSVRGALTETSRIIVRDLFGRQLEVLQPRPGKTAKVDFSAKQPGIYFLEITDGTSVREVIKITKK